MLSGALMRSGPLGSDPALTARCPSLHCGQRLARKGKKAMSRIGERHPPAQPVEQRHAQLFLQRLDLRGHVRLHRVNPFRRAREVQLFGEDAKDLQLTDFHRLSPIEMDSILSIYWTNTRGKTRLSSIRRTRNGLKWLFFHRPEVSP